MKTAKIIGAGVIAAAGVLGAMAQSLTDKGVSSDTALARNINVFNTITRLLAETYVDSLRPDAAFNAAIGAMLYTVDPYTEYYDAEEVERLEVMTTGSYGGIGAILLTRDGETYISMPMEGSPSMKAGLKAGDRILRVDTLTVTGRPSDFAVKLLKGDPGTKVTVTVERPYSTDSILTFDIMRERVQDKSVPFYGMVDGVGYVKLNSFQEHSADEVRAAFESFKGNPDLKGVVLDLRGNGGGLVSTAVDILGMVLPRGTRVLETRGKDETSNKAYTTNRSPLLPETPLVILIDEDSASASEITAGAVQDLDRGVLVGRRSFGKGLVQSTLSLPYDGVLKVTTAKYHLPSGRLIQALDYSRRNPDGSVAPTPDSLTNEFATRHGRIVRDGGGLVPDSVVEAPDYSRLMYNLMVSNQIFDYATKFAAEHSEIPAPGEFVITDEIFADFVAFVDTTKVKSDRSGERILADLRKTATTEGFMTDELSAQLDALALLMGPDLNRDLYNRRSEIEGFLGREIVSRFYGRGGEERYSIRFDPEFAVAVSILNEPDLYSGLLSPKPSPGKK